MKNTYTLLAIVVIIVIASFIFINNQNSLAIKNKVSSNFVTTTENIKKDINAPAKLINEQGKKRYLNEYYGINFDIPSGWTFSEQYVNNGIIQDGFIQMFNFKQDGTSKSFLQNQNKIEGVFSGNSNYSKSSEDIYTTENLKLYQINISNKKVNVAEGNYGGLNFKTYYVPTSKIDTYLNITIYGNIKNFDVLEGLVNKM